MRKYILMLLVCFIPVLAISAPNVYVGIHKGDIDGFYGYWVTGTASTCLISTGSLLSASYTDWSIELYSTCTYTVKISTTSNIREATATVPCNYWLLSGGESLSPDGILKNAPIFAIMSDASAEPSKVQVMKCKHSD